MEQYDTYKITRQFFAQGCKNLNFKECEKLWNDFNASLRGPGCTSCKRRRMRNKYSRIIAEIMKNLNYKDVMQPQKNESQDSNV